MPGIKEVGVILHRRQQPADEHLPERHRLAIREALFEIGTGLPCSPAGARCDTSAVATKTLPAASMHRADLDGVQLRAADRPTPPARRDGSVYGLGGGRPVRRGEAACC